MPDLDRSPLPRRPLGDRVRAAATPRAIGVAVALYLASVVALQVSTAQVAGHADGFTKPDLTFGYDHPRVVDALGSLGDAGRSAYGLNLVIDSLMPAAFALATVLAAAGAFPRRLALLSIAPVAFLVLDLAENASLGVMLATHPDVPPALVAATSLVTMAKLAAYPVAFATFATAVAALLVGRVRFAPVRLAGWAIAQVVTVVVLVTLFVDPAAYTPVAAAVAVATGLALAASAERGRARTG